VLESCVDRQENERRVDVREQRIRRRGYTGKKLTVRGDVQVLKESIKHAVVPRMVFQA